MSSSYIEDPAETMLIGSLKTDLFSRVAKIDRLQRELDQVLVLPAHQRRKWVKQHEPLLNTTIDSLVVDSLLVLEAVDGDMQEMTLSIEFVKKLQDVMSVMNAIMYGQASEG